MFSKRMSLKGWFTLPLFSILLFCGGPQFNEEELKKFAEAQALFRNQKFDDAEKLISSLRSSKKSNAEAAVLHAKIRFFQRDFKAAEEILLEALKKNEGNPYVAMWLGRVIMVDPKRQEEAGRFFRSILERDPENFTAHYYLGRTLENEKKARLALLEYQAALAHENQISKTHLQMVRLFTGLSMHDRAKKHRDRVHALGASTADLADADELLASAHKPEKK